MFDLDHFIARLREAAVAPQACEQVRVLMDEAFGEPQAIAAAMPPYPGEDQVLFEDDTVSIWHCRFEPELVVPPHDHQTTATIGVYRGVEDNRFYRRENGALVHKSTRRLAPGDVMAIGPDGIHSVQAAGNQHSYAIHVYLAALTRIERSLFDWDSGEPCQFNDDNYARLKRQA